MVTLVFVFQVGLQVLLDDKDIFECYEELLDVVFYSEVGASRAIFNSGYSIDSLMSKYQGVDWREKSNWQCNGWYGSSKDPSRLDRRLSQIFNRKCELIGAMNRTYQLPERCCMQTAPICSHWCARGFHLKSKVGVLPMEQAESLRRLWLWWFDDQSIGSAFRQGEKLSIGQRLDNVQDGEHIWQMAALEGAITATAPSVLLPVALLEKSVRWMINSYASFTGEG